jgi:hypothetical protein
MHMKLSLRLILLSFIRPAQSKRGAQKRAKLHQRGLRAQAYIYLTRLSLHKPAGQHMSGDTHTSSDSQAQTSDPPCTIKVRWVRAVTVWQHKQ